jgi:gliding motility-associated-like protein
MGSSSQSTNLFISSSLGEPVTGSEIGTSGSFTQGFQQPSSVSLASITYDISVKDETCPDTKDGSIQINNLNGCDNNEYHVEWGDEATGLQRSNLLGGWYYFTLVACGVVILDSVNVGRIYENSCLLNFYTAFSPNNDGINDLWEIDNINADLNKINEIKIFNRWGGIIRTFKNYDNSASVWDGKNEKGKEVTEGTYYFVADIGDRNYSGYIEVTR